MVNMFSFVMTILKREKHMWRHAPFLCIYIFKAKILTLEYIKEIFQRYSNKKISSRALSQTVWAKKNVVVLTHLCIRSNAAKLNNFVAIIEKKTLTFGMAMKHRVSGVTVNKDIISWASPIVPMILVSLAWCPGWSISSLHMCSRRVCDIWLLDNIIGDCSPHSQTYIETCMHKNIDVHCWKQ